LSFDGGKNGDGVYQAIMNQMPPHKRYVELFLDSGAIMRRKRPAETNLAVEIDPMTFGAAKTELSSVPALTMFNECAIQWLRGDWGSVVATPDTLVYADPPYLLSVRSCQRDLYRHEFHTPDEHRTLLGLLDRIGAMVIISGYASSLYAALLRAPKWRTVKFIAGSRGGPREEVLWCNFPDPIELHDYAYLGRDFTDRQRIARKVKRFTAKLANLPSLERNAILASIAKRD
jgi:DNA adenine methylase